MTGCSAVFEIQLSQHEPMLHEVVPNEYAVMPETAPHRVVPDDVTHDHVGALPAKRAGCGATRIRSAVLARSVVAVSPASTTLLPQSAERVGRGQQHRAEEDDENRGAGPIVLVWRQVELSLGVGNSVLTCTP